jgi:hypothetical protein
MAQSYYVNVESTGGGGSGIGYRRIIPSQYTSYRTGDTGWHTQNGTFDYSSDSTCVSYTQDLDYTTYGADGFYRLKYNNTFGNTYRFTNDIGNPPDVGNAGFSAGGFSGATDAYVIDHLTGVGYYVRDLGVFVNSWNNAIDAVVTSSALGYSDWFPLTIEHGESVINSLYSYVSNNNIFYYIDVVGVPFNFFWYGDTIERASTNAYYHRVAQSVIDFGVKTGLSSATMLIARNHY